MSGENERLNKAFIDMLRDKKVSNKVRLKKAQYLVSLGADVNANLYGKSALSWAKEIKDENLVQYLEEKGAKEWELYCHQRRLFGLQLVGDLSEGKVDRVDELLEKGADLETEDFIWNRTSLKWAVMKCSNDVIMKLIDLGADVNAKNNNSDTPLMYASRYANKDVVKMLLENGADVNVKNAQGWNALQYGASSGKRGVVEVLIKGGAWVDTKDVNGYTELMGAVRNCNKEAVLGLLKNGADVNAKDNKDISVLMWGIKKSNKKIVEILLKAGAQVEAVDKNGMTPLMYACRNRNKEFVELLLGAGADVEAKNNEGKTSLDLINQWGYSELMDVFNKFGNKKVGKSRVVLECKNGER